MGGLTCLSEGVIFFFFFGTRFLRDVATDVTIPVLNIIILLHAS